MMDKKWTCLSKLKATHLLKIGDPTTASSLVAKSLSASNIEGPMLLIQFFKS